MGSSWLCPPREQQQLHGTKMAKNAGKNPPLFNVTSTPSLLSLAVMVKGQVCTRGDNEPRICLAASFCGCDGQLQATHAQFIPRQPHPQPLLRASSWLRQNKSRLKHHLLLIPPRICAIRHFQETGPRFPEVSPSYRGDFPNTLWLEDRSW